MLRHCSHTYEWFTVRELSTILTTMAVALVGVNLYGNESPLSSPNTQHMPSSLALLPLDNIHDGAVFS